MLESMTAFGRGEFRNSKGRFSVEIQSVNRRYLEILVLLPRQLSRFEPEIRKLVAGKIERGKVSVFLNVEFNPAKVTLIRPNVGLARSLMKSYELLAAELGYKWEPDLSHILRNKDVIEEVVDLDDVGEFWMPVAKATEKALREIRRMKRAEGSAIAADIRLRLNRIGTTLAGVKRNAGKSADRYRMRLIRRIAEIGRNQLENDEKVLREVAIYAERTDIAEEITRMESHIKQFGTYMKSRQSVGRTLDFLVQEMHREINTIGAKSADLNISKSVVRTKSELEKIREQVQNIV